MGPHPPLVVALRPELGLLVVQAVRASCTGGFHFAFGDEKRLIGVQPNYYTPYAILQLLAPRIDEQLHTRGGMPDSSPC